MNTPAWRRWALFVALLTLGAGYIAVYVFFGGVSVDFIQGRLNERALDFSREHLVTPPFSLSFQSGSRDVGRLGSGWHKPEAQGVWSSTTDSWIELALAQPPSASADWSLRMNAKAFTARSEPRMSITIDVNGNVLGSWVRDASNAAEPMVAKMPLSIVESRNLAIHVHLDHVGSPLVLREGRDGRHLGILLTSISLGE